MGTARHFNGSAPGDGGPGLPTDYLLSPNSSDSYAGMTWCGWVTRDWLGSRNCLSGRFWDAGNGWAVFVDENNLFSFFSTGAVVTVACPDLTLWRFLAVTYDSTVASPQVHFYASNAEGPATTIAEIGTATKTGTFGELGTYGLACGWATFGAVQSLNSWNGNIDNPRLYHGALTLEQLQATAFCGSVVSPETCKYIMDITGADPEPSLWGGAPPDVFSVVGTTVVTGVRIGCDFAEPEEPPVIVYEPPQLMTCM